MTTRPQILNRRSRLHLTFAIFATAAAVSAIGGCATHPAPTRSSLTQPAQTGDAAVAPVQADAAGASAACSLVTAAAVSTAIGEPMTRLGGEAADCAYSNADHSQQLLVHVFLDQTNMDNLVQQLESSSAHVDGLGADAFWNGTIDMMFVRKGNRGFTITSTSLGAKSPGDPDAPKSAMVALANAAMSNF